MTSQKENNLTNQIKYHFASKIEGQKLLAENTDYYQRMNQADIEWRLKIKGATIEDLKAFSQKCILELTFEEKDYINKSIKFIEDSIQSYGFKLPFPKEDIIFIKTSMENEGGASGYTHKTQIYLGEKDFPKINSIMSKEEKEKKLSDCNELIAHELFHCLTRNSPNFRCRMYNLIGFTVLDNELNFPSEIKNKITINPDVDRFDNYGEFIINGVKRKCELIIIYTKTWPKVEEEGRKNDSFFFHIMPVLVPIDTLNIYYPCYKIPEFMGNFRYNTSYAIAPEEILADNFKEIIIKSNLNNLPNQELLKNMIAAMKE